MEGLLTALMAGIYVAQLDLPPQAPPERHAAEVKRHQHLCEVHQTDQHPALRSVVREFVYDWNFIIRPFAEPLLPLSNNVAEQALRRWVISRRISHGTRSEEGSRAFALLARDIETCRRRGASVWQYLGIVIAASRKGLALPAIPA